MSKYLVSIFMALILASCSYAPAMAETDVHATADQVCTHYTNFVRVVDGLRRRGAMARDIITAVNNHTEITPAEKDAFQKLVILSFQSIPAISNDTLRDKLLKNLINSVYLDCYTSYLNSNK